MARKKEKLILILIISFTLIIKFSTIYASSSYDFWQEATNWFGGGQILNILSDKDNVAGQVINTLTDMINIVGTAAFMIVTAFLGIKYMYGSIESKVSIKENMITLLVAATFFFGWQSIINIIYPENAFILTTGTSDVSSMVNRIYSIFIYVGNFFAIGAIIYIGVRYLTAGASGRADLKSKSVQFILGTIMAFATINFLTYISRAINAVL